MAPGAAGNQDDEIVGSSVEPDALAAALAEQVIGMARFELVEHRF